MINVQCSCGNRTQVSDALAGRTIRCRACGQPVAVKALKPGAGKAPVKQQGRAGTVVISQGQVTALVVLAVLGTIGATFYFGPVRTWQRWNQMEPTASNQVQDVVLYGLQAYLSENGEYDPAFQHLAPQIDGPVSWFPPVAAMRLPDQMAFLGRTNQGVYSGMYDTRTGEIQAKVEYGGYSVAGLVTARAATGSFNMTGRENNGIPQAEVNGVSLHMISHPRAPSQY
jgi:hypothetical protein